jgi:hypothetical protein
MALQPPAGPLGQQYPIGRLLLPETLSPSERQAAIGELAAFPQQLGAALEGLAGPQLDTPYRDPIDGVEAWTIRRLVHHLADSLDCRERHGWH